MYNILLVYTPADSVAYENERAYFTWINSSFNLYEYIVAFILHYIHSYIHIYMHPADVAGRYSGVCWNISKEKTNAPPVCFGPTMLSSAFHISVRSIWTKTYKSVEGIRFWPTKKTSLAKCSNFPAHKIKTNKSSNWTKQKNRKKLSVAILLI